ncbi:anti-sigma factor [Cystobacter fuscus]|uniref:anti-sigma factor family protein n=1 Tax=Cystobacter fuscus TaxID=43 RepID=UPI002B2E644D|nr:anti-sigma factor [Cystobacter fuscus]
MTPLIPTEDELHAYVDGQLDDGRRREVEAWLEATPEWAETVAAWKRDAERLRAAHANPYALSPAPQLEPSAIRRSLRARTRQRVALAAALVLTAGVGAVGGWVARSMTMAATLPPMEDALQAYRLFAMDQTHALELDATKSDDLKLWLVRNLGPRAAVPDLQAHGFTLLGGQLLSTDVGAAALLLYEARDGRRLGFYMRPGSRVPGRTEGLRRDGVLLTHYWFRDGYGFAVISLSDDPRADEVKKALDAST